VREIGGGGGGKVARESTGTFFSEGIGPGMGDGADGGPDCVAGGIVPGLVDSRGPWSVAEPVAAKSIVQSP
jgi:hypothetical protein